MDVTLARSNDRPELTEHLTVMPILALLLALAVGSGAAIAHDQADGPRAGLRPHFAPALLVRIDQPGRRWDLPTRRLLTGYSR